MPQIHSTYTLYIVLEYTLTHTATAHTHTHTHTHTHPTRTPLPVRPSHNFLLPALALGAAMGGGLEIALLTDMIIAGDKAKFAVPETKLGIFPGLGGSQTLPRVGGTSFAKSMLFTGRVVEAQEMLANGVVTAVVEAGGAEAKAHEFAQMIAKNGPYAVRQAKKAVHFGMQTDFATAWRMSLECYEQAFKSPERTEGVLAFNEKRPPNFPPLN